MSKQDIEELQKLININKDACEFYQDAHNDIENTSLKRTFSELQNLHKGVIVNFQNQIVTLGGDPETDETMAGQVQQFWGELMAKISNDVDETLVKHLEEAEDRCLHSVQDALDNEDISESTKSLLRQEHNTLRKTHDYMKSLKDTMKEAA